MGSGVQEAMAHRRSPQRHRSQNGTQIGIYHVMQTGEQRRNNRFDLACRQLTVKAW